MIWIIIIIAIVLIIVVAIRLSKKTESEPKLSPTFTIQAEKLQEMNTLLDKMVSIGVDGLTSLQMTHDEKISIISDVIKSINESSNSVEQEQKLLLKMATQAFDKILTDLKYGEDTIELIRSEREKFVVGIKNGTVDTYPWDELIEWSDGYQEYLETQLNAVEREIERRKGIKINSDFAKYYINEDNTLKFEVSGITHLSETELAKVKTLKKFDSKVILEHESNNKYDPNAILLKTEDGSKIGYVNKDALPFVHSVIDRITKCEVSRISDHDIPYVWVFIVYSGDCLEVDNN